MFQGKKIFFAALDWGLGHVTRSLPIINDLKQNNEIILGVTSETRSLYEQHFPHLEKVLLPSYNIKYSNLFPAWLKVLLQWPHISSVISQEKKILDELIKNKKADTVISDSRFGLYGSVHSVFITHQLNIQVPFFAKKVNGFYYQMIKKFNECWVLDFEAENEKLAGILSANKCNLNIDIKYIGPKSALMMEADISSAEKTDVLVLLSGPEPQRSIFEDMVRKKLVGSEKNVVLVRGTENERTGSGGKIKTFNILYGSELQALICKADLIICRSGYSTLMDLHFLKKKNILLVPTPGQPEQEYLAKYWQKQFGAQTCQQKRFSGKEINY
jgi:UDP-N-acetylglucosamine:LPS N-acetylglucosamine transferase